VAIKLGSMVVDSLTGFTGIAVGRTVYLYGCVRIAIESTTLNKDGQPIEAVWVDEQRVEVVKKQSRKISSQSDAKTGGPQADPSRRADSIR